MGPGWGHESPKLGLDSVAAQAPAELNFRDSREPQVCRRLPGDGRLFAAVMEQIFLYTDSWREWLGKSNRAPFMETNQITSKSLRCQHPV